MEDFIMLQPSINEVNSEIASILAMVMVMILFVVFIVLVLCIVVSLYVRWCLLRTEGTFLFSWGRRVSHQGPPSAVAVRRRGLDRATFRSLPVSVYDPKDFTEGLECSVCISEVLQGDVIRVLPKCNHGFHLECIDKWFKSHSTCPLCRNVVSCQNQSGSSLNPDVHYEPEVNSDSDSPDSDSDSDSDSESDNEGASIVHLREALAFPTNVLFWGNEDQLRSLGEATTSTSRDELVIDIPRELCDDCLSSPPSIVVSRLSSLSRLLSRGC
ncbi:hypothetical protein RND81_04G135400 [Saponaria officinalis]|uniref:RING-type E3 ubiquitin transferase n=1 Tax=Saponaria officinalis TaxID=3572 RepID=A0AAW1LLP4_SAPOF